MKEYKVMVKRIKTGEWVKAAAFFGSGIFNSKDRAIEYAKDFLKRDEEHDIRYYCDYKIMAREVSEWEDA